MVAIQTYTGTLLAGTCSTVRLTIARTVERGSRGSSPSLRTSSPVVSVSVKDGMLLEIGSPFISSRVDRHVAPRWKALCSSMKLQSSCCRNAAGIVPPRPVELVDKNFRALFRAGGETQDLNLALLRLVRFGGQVRVIGPAQACASNWNGATYQSF